MANPVGNLVMLRVGGAQVTAPHDLDPKHNMLRELFARRICVDGKFLYGDSKANGADSEPVEFLPGELLSPN